MSDVKINEEKGTISFPLNCGVGVLRLPLQYFKADCSEADRQVFNYYVEQGKKIASGEVKNIVLPSDCDNYGNRYFDFEQPVVMFNFPSIKTIERSGELLIATDKQIARLQSQLQTQDRIISALPKTQQAILELASNVQVNTDLYNALLNKSQC